MAAITVPCQKWLVFDVMTPCKCSGWKKSRAGTVRGVLESGLGTTCNALGAMTLARNSNCTVIESKSGMEWHNDFGRVKRRERIERIDGRAKSLFIVASLVGFVHRIRQTYDRFND